MCWNLYLGPVEGGWWVQAWAAACVYRPSSITLTGPWGPPTQTHTKRCVCVSDGSFCSLHMICVCWTVVHKTIKMKTHTSHMNVLLFLLTDIKVKEQSVENMMRSEPLKWCHICLSCVTRSLIDWLIFQREEDLWASSFHDGLSGCRSANTDHPEEEGGRGGARWATSHTKLKCFYYTTAIHHHDMNHWSSTH